MEHEVFVPVPVPTLLRTLGDPARVARCVPGLQQDADAASPLAGRLKLRVGGHTITYRGELLLTGPDRDRFAVTGKGVEARGTGAVELALTIGLTATDGGTTISYSGTADGDGRLVELEEGAALAAAHRLLERFTQQLVTESLAGREDADADADADTDADADAGTDADADDAVAAEGLAGDEEGPGVADGSGDEIRSADEIRAGDAHDVDGPGGDDHGSVYDSPVPPPSLDPVAGVEFTVPDEPPAEAAHARRTMIGRSAE
ncbi:carbon monoxide dehydrogenase, partial [Streptomyces sp. SID7982]|nr:carbon monoxide dehydrogenase [Streptomyces sp. SID7982]